MQALPPAIEVYPVHHLPIMKAYADQLGLVSLINHYVPTAMEVDASTVMLALVLDTLSGRSPLYCLEEFFAQQDTALLFGKAVPPHALHDDTAGRVLDRLYAFGPMRLFTACAVRAATRLGLKGRYGHFDTTARSVWGAYQYAETPALPFPGTMADAALVTADNRAALRHPLFITRWPATDRACGRVLAEAVAHNAWEEGACHKRQDKPGVFWMTGR